jgi:hypothetical protein
MLAAKCRPNYGNLPEGTIDDHPHDKRPRRDGDPTLFVIIDAFEPYLFAA